MQLCLVELGSRILVDLTKLGYHLLSLGVCDEIDCSSHVI